MAVTDRVTYSIVCSGPAVGVNKPAKFECNVPQLTAANLDATETALAALATALQALTFGVVAEQNLSTKNVISTSPLAVTANRSQKFILTTKDTDGREYRSTIPAASTASPNVITGTNATDLTSTNWAAFKTAYEAIATSPTALTLTLISAVLGGRRA